MEPQLIKRYAFICTESREMFLLSKYEIEKGLIPTKLYNGIILLSKCLLTDELLLDCCKYKGLATMVPNPCTNKCSFKPFNEEEASQSLRNYAKLFKIPKNLTCLISGRSLVNIKQEATDPENDTKTKVEEWREKI